MEYHDPQFANPDQVLSPPMPWPAPPSQIILFLFHRTLNFRYHRVYHRLRLAMCPRHVLVALIRTISPRRSLALLRAIWHARNNPEVLELTAADRQLVCRHPPATSARAGHLATELLPRGCYFDPLDHPLRTAVGHWDPDNAIFRCAMVCPACRARACNRRMWYKLDDHDSHLCDFCKD